jgi:hypothetical protein
MGLNVTGQVVAAQLLYRICRRWDNNRSLSALLLVHGRITTVIARGAVLFPFRYCSGKAERGPLAELDLTHPLVER